MALPSESSTTREPYIPPDITALTSDARSWYLKGVANSEKDFDKFPSLVKMMAEESPEYKIPLGVQLSSLLEATKEGNANLKVLVPQLNGLVDSLWEWSQPPISTWSKIKLKGVLWYIDGKRDNKSYYLFNGGGLWCQKRAELLRAVAGDGQKFAKDFDELQDKILLARDNLEEGAQKYVTGVTELMTLIKDVETNGQKIHEIAGNLKKEQEKSVTLLQSGDSAVEAVQQEIQQLQ